MKNQVLNISSYFVNNNCIACMLCSVRLPNHFKLNDETLNSFVCCQPATSDDNQLFCEAMNDCPANAIEKIFD
ncbi:ferredoxin [Candidatus Magnetomorum sp. HK-1]|nr:ferredoxin [Candidatus Magnetomorum sp. HK-1]